MSNEVTNMMLNDSKDLLDNVEITTIAAECVKLKQKTGKRLLKITVI